MNDYVFMNESYKAWAMWLGAMILFLIAWRAVINLTIRGVETVVENV